MSLSKEKFSSFIKDFNFRELFNEMGWNNDKSVVPITITDEIYTLQGIASKSGFKILSLPYDKKIPSKDIRKKIQRTVSKYFYEHLIIYYDTKKSHQIWQTAIRLPNKPIKIHEVVWCRSQDPEILYQRTSGLFFTFEEEEILTIVDVLKKIQDNFNTNSEKITKKFYERFKKEHGAFYSFIEGIEGESDQRWYASLMLNRLMFIYFIQKKGFLDGDINYLKNKLNSTRELRGTNKFYKSFYKLFLCKLFHEGLGKPHESDKKLIGLIGKVPYLNGGLFDIHELEKDNDQLDVKDEAFVRLFDFFDEYNWHLDDRITASGKDINPDVIGYIFEKYINDRASMGAYYTKEDITEYISKNCIIPFLFDRAKENCTNAFLPSSSIWQMLKQDPDRYIYDAVKHGINFDSGIREGLPDDVLAGLDAPDSELVEKRKVWNKPAPADIALPTEIYREVIARRKRYFDIRQKIESGKITEINDFITYNLNIRQFAQDAIDNYEGSDFIESFYAAIAGRKYDEKNSAKEPTMGITILDPTCGSGAFLFAALNVLEPLYEGCIKRMREFVEVDNAHSGKKFKQFRIVLKEIETHPSESYYILKSIILNNLYGVDIMKEAVETAKLRLFLKLVAQTDDFEHIEPLPDIDFNIRCGNTLVGFANENEIHNSNSGSLDFDNYTGKIKEQSDIVSHAFQRYKQIQLSSGLSNYSDFVQAKTDLNLRLKNLNEKLNILLHKQSEGIEFNKWLAIYHPFHWFAEFYEIVHENDGFDVLIGNPPYVELGDGDDYFTKNYTLHSCGNLYALILERALMLKATTGFIGMIVPLSISSSNRMKPLQLLYKSRGTSWISNYEGGTNPSVMFNGVKQNLSIVIHKKSIEKGILFSTKIYRFFSEEREFLFGKIKYSINKESFIIYGFPKISEHIEYKILQKLFSKKPLAYHITTSSNNVLYIHRIASYYIKCFDFIPYFKSDRDGVKKSEDYKPYKFKNNSLRYLSVLSSSTFYIYWLMLFDLFKAGKYAIESFPTGDLQNDKNNKLLDKLGLKLMKDIKSNSKRMIVNYKKTGKVEYDQFFPRLSKDIMDEIDIVIADHYGFTQEELDFIINYDIKYRMGKELDNGEDEE